MWIKDMEGSAEGSMSRSPWANFFISPVKSPCSRECERRTITCKKTCKDWKKYEGVKAENLKEREKVYKINDATYACANKRNHSFSTQGGAKFKHGNRKGY